VTGEAIQIMILLFIVIRAEGDQSGRIHRVFVGTCPEGWICLQLVGLFESRAIRHE